MKAKPYGIRWTEFSRNDRQVQKERFFERAEARERWMNQIEQRPSFHQFTAFLDPKPRVFYDVDGDLIGVTCPEHNDYDPGIPFDFEDADILSSGAENEVQCLVCGKRIDRRG